MPRLAASGRRYVPSEADTMTTLWPSAWCQRSRSSIVGPQQGRQAQGVGGAHLVEAGLGPAPEQRREHGQLERVAVAGRPRRGGGGQGGAPVAAGVAQERHERVLAGERAVEVEGGHPGPGGGRLGRRRRLGHVDAARAGPRPCSGRRAPRPRPGPRWPRGPRPCRRRVGRVEAVAAAAGASPGTVLSSVVMPPPRARWRAGRAPPAGRPPGRRGGTCSRWRRACRCAPAGSRTR